MCRIIQCGKKDYSSFYLRFIMSCETSPVTASYTRNLRQPSRLVRDISFPQCGQRKKKCCHYVMGSWRNLLSQREMWPRSGEICGFLGLYSQSGRKHLDIILLFL